MTNMIVASVATALILAVPARAAETPQPSAATPAYNYDFKPDSQVAPGFYGNMSPPRRQQVQALHTPPCRPVQPAP